LKQILEFEYHVSVFTYLKFGGSEPVLSEKLERDGGRGGGKGGEVVVRERTS
jgi:hypothetical protein